MYLAFSFDGLKGFMLNKALCLIGCHTSFIYLYNIEVCKMRQAILLLLFKLFLLFKSDHNKIDCIAKTFSG